MNLYDRDYRKLNQQEDESWRMLKARENAGQVGKLHFTHSLFHEYPKAVRHYITLFPNNYLDIFDLKEVERLEQQLKDFEALLESDGVNENAILRFIDTNRAYFVVGSLLKHFHFGHHDAFLFREFQLGNSHQVDCLLVGRASGGWEFVFVELESPTSNITLKHGELGDAFRKGQNQVADWDSWLERHFPSLRETFDKHKQDGEVLPNEFVVLDKTRIHYVVVAGRRTNFYEKTYRIRRGTRKDQDLLLLHYDNLIDSARQILGAETY